jgi:hypothetical protein
MLPTPRADTAALALVHLLKVIKKEDKKVALFAGQSRKSNTVENQTGYLFVKMHFGTVLTGIFLSMAG